MIIEEIKTWVTWNLKTKFNVNGVSWQIMFPLVCHQLWLARNKRVFDGGDSNPQAIIAKFETAAFSLPIRDTLGQHRFPGLGE